MTMFRVGPAGIPASLKTDMNAVLNKKFGTSGQNYPPKQWPDDVNLLGPLPEKTVSGAIATFDDGADDVPTKSLVVTIPPTLSGDSEVSVMATGKNLLNPSDLVVGSINSSGANINSQTRVRSGYVKINGGQKYSVSIGGSVQIFEIHQYKADFTKAENLISVNAQSYVLTASNDTAFIRLLMRFSNNATISVSDITELQVETGDTVTAYEAYNGTQYTASLGRTIYGGTADIVNGTGTDENNKFTVTSDMSDSIRYIGSGNTAYIQINNSPASNSRWQDLVCSHFTPANIYAGGTQQGIGCYSTQFYIRDSRFTSKQDFLDFLTEQETLGTPLEICYKLATPTDFTFTGQEVPTRLGVNNFWSDEGDTTVVYRRDIDLALQAVSGSRGLMMASRPVTQLVGEESDPDQVNELVEDDENDKIEQEGEDDAR